MSLVSFNENRGDIVKNCIEENDYKIARTVEKKVNSELNKKSVENGQLRENVDYLNKKIKLLYMLIIFILLVFIALLFYYFIS